MNNDLAFERMRNVGGPRQHPAPATGFPPPRTTAEIIGVSPSLREVMRQVDKVTATESTVLIQGETGTGKELIARAIHDGSPRKHGPFIKLNAAAIPANLLESELFGHERGSFTGALTRRIGRFEQAQDGTIFLDEIGELAPDLQPKLLRVLQERAFERIGGMQTVTSNARLITATNRDLGGLVAAGKFRSDLYYRLSVFPIEVPPLRDRREDIALLAAHFVERLSRRLNRPGLVLSSASVARLEEHGWPGNIRQLENVLERAVILSTSAVVEVQPERARSPCEPQSDFDLEAFIRERLLPNAEDLYGHTHDQVDRLLLARALDHTHGNQRDAARLLGISRQTLRIKLRALGLEVTHSVRSDSPLRVRARSGRPESSPRDAACP